MSAKRASHLLIPSSPRRGAPRNLSTAGATAVILPVAVAVMMALVMALGTAGVALSQTGTGSPGAHQITHDCTNPPPDSPGGQPAAASSHTNQGLRTIDRSSTIPNLPNFAGADPKHPRFLDSVQCMFDVFSWQSFIALSFAQDGTLGSTDQPAIWEGWPVSTDIFLANGADPGPWDRVIAQRHVPAACRALANSGSSPIFSQLGKSDFLRATSEPFNSGPLVATNGYYTRYTISVNEDMYGYLHGNQLYSKAGQRRFANAGHSVVFPCGCHPDSHDPPQQCSRGGQVGAVMVKAAWKVLLPAEDQSTFHTADALVYTPAQGNHAATCVARTMGLVGFHIAHKTQTEPQWVWSTFEHVSNVPPGSSPPPTGSFNYFRPNCNDCNEVNEPPPLPWNIHAEPVSDRSLGSQILRETPIRNSSKVLSDKVRGHVLDGTVWSNYELISTQWPTAGKDKTQAHPHGPAPVGPSWCVALNRQDREGNPFPLFLANTTLETYNQGTVPKTSSSCIECHNRAGLAVGGTDNHSDFTFLLEIAQ